MRKKQEILLLNGKIQKWKEKEPIKQFYFSLSILIIFTISFFHSTVIVEKTNIKLEFTTEIEDLTFNSTKAYEIIRKQVELGARYPGSSGIEKTRKLIASELQTSNNWQITFQNFTKTWDDQEITLSNIICHPPNFNDSSFNFILMAHYDTRLWADKDPDPEKRKNPVPGANDGASGVGVGLELGRILVNEYNFHNFQLIFFDAEDQGNILGWDWLIGSRFFVESSLFSAQDVSWAILLDMVGANNATFKKERNSVLYGNEILTKIWDEAASLNYDSYFINESWRAILDDHIPFLEKGIPSIDIIDDFVSRYNPWHTTSDNITHIDVETLEAVGFTLESALEKMISSPEWMSNLTKIDYASEINLMPIIGGIMVLIVKLRSRRKIL